MKHYDNGPPGVPDIPLRDAIVLSVITLGIYAALTTTAYAIGNVLCGSIGTIMMNGLARGIATIGVLIVGVGATLGRMSWTTAICVSVGIAAMYSTGYFVLVLSGNQQAGCFGT
jgi:type IV secretory pathway VirB2 component (pilin)